MLKTLLLVLPVLIPSWRFFKSIEPSPRVQWALFSKRNSAPVVWHEFRPRPLAVTSLRMVLRLFWNPSGSDALFVVSCAERIQQDPTAHSIQEISRRIQSDLEKMGMGVTDQMLRFRLVFMRREGGALVQEIVFLSDAVPAAASKT